MKADARIEKLLHEILAEGADPVSEYGVSIQADPFHSWTISLFEHRLIRGELGHWHTDDLVAGLKMALLKAQEWGETRRRADSNRRARLCRPLPNHSATTPKEPDARP